MLNQRKTVLIIDMRSSLSNEEQRELDILENALARYAPELAVHKTSHLPTSYLIDDLLRKAGGASMPLPEGVKTDALLCLVYQNEPSRLEHHHGGKIMSTLLAKGVPFHTVCSDLNALCRNIDMPVCVASGGGSKSYADVAERLRKDGSLGLENLFAETIEANGLMYEALRQAENCALSTQEAEKGQEPAADQTQKLLSAFKAAVRPHPSMRATQEDPRRVPAYTPCLGGH